VAVKRRYFCSAIVGLFLFCLLDLHAQSKPDLVTVYWVSLTIVPSNPRDCVDRPRQLLLQLNEDGTMVLNQDEVTIQQIRRVFHDILQTRSGDGKQVFLKADGKLRYGEVINVIKELSPSDPEIRVVLLTPTLESAPCAPPMPLIRSRDEKRHTDN